MEFTHKLGIKGEKAKTFSQGRKGTTFVLKSKYETTTHTYLQVRYEHKVHFKYTKYYERVQPVSKISFQNGCQIILSAK